MYSGNKWKKNWNSNICFVFLLVLHKNKIEGAVEDCVDKVRGGQIEDEEVGHGPHLPVIWTKTVRVCPTKCRQFNNLDIDVTSFSQYLEKTATKGRLYIDNFCVSICHRSM